MQPPRLSGYNDATRSPAFAVVAQQDFISCIERRREEFSREIDFGIRRGSLSVRHSSMTASVFVTDPCRAGNDATRLFSEEGLDHTADVGTGASPSPTTPSIDLYGRTVGSSFSPSGVGRLGTTNREQGQSSSPTVQRISGPHRHSDAAAGIQTSVAERLSETPVPRARQSMTAASIDRDSIPPPGGFVEARARQIDANTTEMLRDPLNHKTNTSTFRQPFNTSLRQSAAFSPPGLRSGRGRWLGLGVSGAGLVGASHSTTQDHPMTAPPNVVGGVSQQHRSSPGKSSLPTPRGQKTGSSKRGTTSTTRSGASRVSQEKPVSARKAGSVHFSPMTTATPTKRRLNFSSTAAGRSPHTPGAGVNNTSSPARSDRPGSAEASSIRERAATQAKLMMSQAASPGTPVIVSVTQVGESGKKGPSRTQPAGSSALAERAGRPGASLATSSAQKANSRPEGRQRSGETPSSAALEPSALVRSPDTVATPSTILDTTLASSDVMSNNSSIMRAARRSITGTQPKKRHDYQKHVFTSAAFTNVNPLESKELALRGALFSPAVKDGRFVS